MELCLGGGPSGGVKPRCGVDPSGGVKPRGGVKRCCGVDPSGGVEDLQLSMKAAQNGEFGECADAITYSLLI